MNSGANNIKDVYNFITNQLNNNCHILYPGDNWDVSKNPIVRNVQLVNIFFTKRIYLSRPIKSKIVPITESINPE